MPSTDCWRRRGPGQGTRDRSLSDFESVSPPRGNTDLLSRFSSYSYCYPLSYSLLLSPQRLHIPPHCSYLQNPALSFFFVGPEVLQPWEISRPGTAKATAMAGAGDALLYGRALDASDAGDGYYGGPLAGRKFRWGSCRSGSQGRSRRL